MLRDQQKILRPVETLGDSACSIDYGASGRWEARTAAMALRASYEAFSSLRMTAPRKMSSRVPFF